MNRENPRMKRLRDELRSMNCTLERPTAAIIPNMTMKIPPTTGSGMVMKKAPNFEKRPKKIMMRAPHWITRREPT